MASLLIILGILIWFFVNNIFITNKQWRESCERAVQREKEKLENLKRLYDNREVNQTLKEINSLEIKDTEPSVETAQPDAEPTAADNLIKEAKEWKV